MLTFSGFPIVTMECLMEDEIVFLSRIPRPRFVDEDGREMREEITFRACKITGLSEEGDTPC